MYYKNARIFASDFQFHTGSFQVEDGRFGAVLYGDVPEDAVDLKGATVIPGLVDAQARKPMGKLEETSKELAFWGVTAFACATDAADADEYTQIEGGSRFLGLRLENVDAESFDAFAALVKGSQVPVCMAALPANASFLGKASSLCSIALCDAGSSYEQARDGFAAGASFLQDLYRYLPLVTRTAPAPSPQPWKTPTLRLSWYAPRGAAILPWRGWHLPCSERSGWCFPPAARQKTSARCCWAPSATASRRRTLCGPLPITQPALWARAKRSA